MKNESFGGFHPIVNLFFFAAALGLTMFIQQPIYLAISLCAGCAYLLYLRGGRGMLRQVGYLLPLAAVMAVINPLFNHEGVTILFYLPNDNPVTLEAVCYGLASAVMLAASVVWFNCCNEVFTSDKILYLFGRVIPSLSLMLSMTLRFVPRFKHYLQSVLNVQRAMHRPKNKAESLRQALSAFSATISWAMEQSIVSADSMKSRGFGIRARTSFSIFSFEKRDAAALTALLLLCIGAALPCLFGLTEWRYYPSLSGALFGPVQFLAYLCHGGLCFLPLIIDFTEDHKWNSLRSEI